MATLANRPNTARLVIDVQNGVVGAAHGRDDVVAGIGTPIEKARRAGVDVVWFVRGYGATPVGDAHTTEDLSDYGAPPPDEVIAHTNLYRHYHTAPGRTAGTVRTAGVDEVLAGAPAR